MFDAEVGLSKKGTIVSYNRNTREVKVKLNEAVAIRGHNNNFVVCQMPMSLFFNNGVFIGSEPTEGSSVIVKQGIGNKYYVVSYYSDNTLAIPQLKPNELLIKYSDAQISLNKNNNIEIGSPSNKIHIATGNKNTKQNLITFNFENENHFTQAARYVNGVVKRDVKYNTNYDQASKLEGDEYDTKFKVIGMDPSATANDALYGPSKNPPFVESREIVYEFQYNSKIDNDLLESFNYSNSRKSKEDYSFPNRRLSRADTLSLSLLEPNYLIETTKGTVIDIFGNILDINRKIIPIGKDILTIRSDKNEDKQEIYQKIKEAERRSIAYHFEINARKNISSKKKKADDLLDISSNEDNSKIRSRFHLDIDKEGLFKLNVPASSETGNIPLLTRHENYSSFGAEDNNNPNKLIYRKDNVDIYQDSFAAPSISFSDDLELSDERGSITIKDGDASGAPIDRITKAHIKHGTAHHDLLKTCFIHQNNDFINYQKGTTAILTIDLNSISPLTNIVSDTIEISGENANAGGRSGSLNFDGSLEMSIGANTVDRQSLWLDTAGGIIANIGRDKNLRSAAIQMDGDMYFQVGGFGISTDSRFVDQENGYRGAVLDLRVSGSGGYAHMIRIDNNGISIMTPGNVAVHAGGNMKLSSDANMSIEAESLYLNERMVLKSGDSI